MKLSNIVLLSTLLFSSIVQADAENDTPTQTEQPRQINILSCKKLQFLLTYSQEGASQDERKAAFDIINRFLNEQLPLLSEKLATEAPNVNLSLILFDIVEEGSQQVSSTEDATTAHSEEADETHTAQE